MITHQGRRIAMTTSDGMSVDFTLESGPTDSAYRLGIFIKGKLGSSAGIWLSPEDTRAVDDFLAHVSYA